MDAIVSVHRRGAGDPTLRRDRPDRHRWALRTPTGPATLVLTRADEAVYARAWGPGAAWALERLPALLGAEDNPEGFEPRHPALVHAWRRHRHWRIGHTGLVFDALLPSIIEQKVTGQEAYAGYRRLVTSYGTEAPGPPEAAEDLWVPPGPDEVRAVPSWAWLQCGIDPARSRAAVAAARVADSLERLVEHGDEALDRGLRSIPGIGVWTSAETRVRALGSPDAVSFGDFHVPRQIGLVLVGRPVDDEELAELLEPWRPHRHRVQALVRQAFPAPARTSPRPAPRRHLPQ